MRKYLPYLRITWTVFCVLAWLPLIALWMRSHFRTEYVERVVNVNRLYSTGIWERILNLPGDLVFASESVTNSSINYELPGWKYRAYDAVQSKHTRFRFWSKSQSSPQYRVVLVPHYLATLAIGVAGVVPWLFPFTWRFSLRTLLIATTLVACLLGLIVYFAR
jgi:hypothetical protein